MESKIRVVAMLLILLWVLIAHVVSNSYMQAVLPSADEVATEVLSQLDERQTETTTRQQMVAAINQIATRLTKLEQGSVEDGSSSTDSAETDEQK